MTVLEGPNGFRLRLLGRSDEVLEMEATYGGASGMPPEHLHPRQDERFAVLDGSVRAIVDGAERVYVAGETFEVPAGTPHRMRGEGAARVRWEVRPALRTWELFSRLYTSPDASLLEEFADELRLTGA